MGLSITYTLASLNCQRVFLKNVTASKMTKLAAAKVDVKLPFHGLLMTNLYVETFQIRISKIKKLNDKAGMETNLLFGLIGDGL